MIAFRNVSHFTSTPGCNHLPSVENSSTGNPVSSTTCLTKVLTPAPRDVVISFLRKRGTHSSKRIEEEGPERHKFLVRMPDVFLRREKISNDSSRETMPPWCISLVDFISQDDHLNCMGTYKYLPDQCYRDTLYFEQSLQAMICGASYSKKTKLPGLTMLSMVSRLSTLPVGLPGLMTA